MAMIRRVFAASIFALWALSAHAQPAYPTRPIKIIVPAGAGGITDNLARALGDHLARELSQPVIVENRPGAGGIVGAQAVANAAPDGHTLLMAIPAFVANPSLFSKLPYDSIKSFEPVSLVSNVSMVMTVP